MVVLAPLQCLNGVRDVHYGKNICGILMAAELLCFCDLLVAMNGRNVWVFVFVRRLDTLEAFEARASLMGLWRKCLLTNYASW